MECKEEGCHRPAYCRGLCNRDYQRWLGTQEPRPTVLMCRHCGTDFPNPVRQGPDRQFWSPQCKGKYWGAERTRQRAAAPPRPCSRCGAPVMHRTGRTVYDGIAPAQNSAAIASRIRGAQLRGYDGGHLFLFQDPAALPEFGESLQAPSS